MYRADPSGPRAEDLALLETAGRIASVAIEQHQLADRLAHQANHDALTQLPNRLLYEDRLRQALSRARRQKDLVALLMIDLDRFKRINDTLGDHVGDRLLQEVARRLQACIRQNDTLARWGGDEFTMIATDLKTSIDSEEPDELLRNADHAMYMAEQMGKNTFAFFSAELGAAASRTLRLETDLRQALDRRELVLYYQPLIDTATGRTVGIEALVRWRHPVRGLLTPDVFVPIAEETGLIVPIGTWVLREACRQCKVWQRSGHPRLKVAVNASAVQFRRADFVATVLEALERTGLTARSLELEMTESVVMSDLEASIRQLNLLRARHITIAIDDFGTGYSSLSYLPRLPIDILKIDRAFVREVEKDAGTRQVVRAIVALGRSMKLGITAEGVEGGSSSSSSAASGAPGSRGICSPAPCRRSSSRSS